MNGFWFTEAQQAIRDSVLKLCERFDAAYWRRTDETGDFPEAFVTAMAEAGWLGAAMPVELGGSGLGLTLAQTFVQQHLGMIECDSEPGQTVFKIVLPLT